MSILGEARKRLQDAKILKPDTDSFNLDVRVPGLSGGDYQCAEGYHWDAETNSCVPDVVTPATPTPYVPQQDMGGDDHDPGIQYDPNVFDPTQSSGYTGGSVKEQQELADLHSAYQAGAISKEEWQEAVAKSASARHGRAFNTIAKGLVPGGGILSNLFKNFKTKASNFVTQGDVNDPTPAAPETGNLGQQSYINYDSGSASDSNDDSGLSSSSDSYSEASGTDTGSTDVGGWTNQGGMIYKNTGGFPGKPLGTDTVPTWLTEGEFVVDRDSAQKFAPLLKEINDYEPDGGLEGFMSEMDDLINKVGFAKGRSVDDR